jgi:hypothetical protein
VTIRASLFFDGTLNNRNNTEVRMRGEADEDQLESASYTNDLSNIAKIERLLAEQAGYDIKLKLYIEGIGTEDNETDSLALGASMGMGDTGVVSKVEIGLENLYTAITEKVEKTTPIVHVHLDSFGFSRGAAAARHFIHKALHERGYVLQKKLESAGYTVSSGVKVRFVGLFDTVASYGLAHYNDTSDLSLDAVKHAEKVVQLAAAEEHRKNYRLTDIDSAGAKGREIFLPGVHSDIGGSYNTLEDESELQLYTTISASTAEPVDIRREKQWLLSQGWYHEEELLHDRQSSSRPGPHHEVSEIVFHTLKGRPGKPRKVRNHYARIPLHMMARFAGELGLSFTGDLNSKHAVPATLASVKSRLDAYAQGIGESRKSSPSDWFHKTEPMLCSLRHDYLHFSAFYGVIMGANDPQFDGGGPSTARRMRTIQDG